MTHTPQDGRDGRFPSTHLSLVHLVAQPGMPGYREGWERFFRAYWRPLYRWLLATHSDHQDALDLLQEFFLQGLDGGVFSRYDPAQGRFRSYLMGCLAKVRATMKRHEGTRPDRDSLTWVSREELDRVAALPAGKDPEKVFHEEWAKQTFRGAVAAVEGSYHERHDIASLRILREWVLAADRPAAETFASTLSTTTSNLYMRASRVRNAIQKQILGEVRQYAHDEPAARDEMRDLLSLLASGGAA